ncbi:MAG: transposase [cyanobacterium endosymbiont of Rhopalodia sterrenbergii]
MFICPSFEITRCYLEEIIAYFLPKTTQRIVENINNKLKYIKKRTYGL